MGHSDISARKICGSIEAKQASSSQETKYGANPMSQQMDRPPSSEDGGGSVSVPKDKAEALVSAIMNDDLQTAKRIASEIFNIEEEAAPNKPPAKPPAGFPPRR